MAQLATLETTQETPARRNAADVGALREKQRQRRLLRLALLTGPVAAFLWYRMWLGTPVGMPSLPHIDPLYLMSGLFFAVLLITMVATSLVAGRSPHIMFRPEQISTTLDDVIGMPVVREEVSRSLDLFLAGPSFRRDMGGQARRGLLFEGSPGTGKTLMAKAMAREAGVPFLFVSATSFQSMYYGATARRIRSFFNALRKAARAEGGAIAFIEEIDAIATVRGGMATSGMSANPFAAMSGLAGNGLGAVSACCSGPMPMQSNLAAAGVPGAQGGMSVAQSVTSEGVGGVVNELLVQMQSFEIPTTWQRMLGALSDKANLFLPAQRQLPRPKPEPVNVLVIAATNRAESLDPALLRPGRFDRRLLFDLPDQRGRQDILDYYLARKSHDEDVAGSERVAALAGATQGYSPVMLENLLDEALINAVRRGATAMNWKDIEQARLSTEVGLGQPVGYTDHEARLIATHEAGHAVTAWLVAPERRLEILSIIKRGGALGLLAHSDAADVFLRSSRELDGHIRISLGGMVAEELFFDDTTTGPSSDLAYATGIAAQMVGAAGMSDTLISFASVRGSMFSGGDLVSTVLGDSQARAMVESLLQERRDEVRLLLTQHAHLVESLRDALLERHELIGREITDILALADAEAGEPTSRPVTFGTIQEADEAGIDSDTQSVARRVCIDIRDPK